jgi:hypothetical protein
VVDYPSHHAQNLAAVVNGGSIYTSTDAGVSWTEQTNAGSRGWRSIASSSNGTVRLWMQAITQAARCPCPRWCSHRVCMSGEGSPCDARSDASWSTIHPIMHRTLPLGKIQAPSGRRPTRASAGSSEPTLVPVAGCRSRPRPMARYVFGCRP